MKKKYLLLLIIPLGALAFLTLKSCKDDKSIKPQRKQITEAVYASGYLVPENEYKLYALADGYITRTFAETGDAVKAGQPLFQIQSDAQNAKLDASSYAYQVAQQNASDNSPALLDLKNKIRSAEARAANDSLNYARFKNMFDAGAATKAQLDNAKLAADVSHNDLQSAKEIFQRTQAQLNVEARNARSMLTASSTDAGNYMLKSYTDGMVYETYKELGEAVRRNELMALIGSSNKKLLQLQVDQQDIQRIELGQEVVVKMDVTGGKVFKARISKIYPNMNMNDQSFKVEAQFSDTAQFAFAHASVEANVIIRKKENALVIPKSLLQNDNEVLLKNIANGKAVKIEKGLENMEEVEVVKGLKDDDELVMPKAK